MGSKDLAPSDVVATTHISSQASSSSGDVPMASNNFCRCAHNDQKKSFREALILGETNIQQTIPYRSYRSPSNSNGQIPSLFSDKEIEQLFNPYFDFIGIFQKCSSNICFFYMPKRHPLFCSHCKIYGHDNSHCFKLQPKLEQKKPNTIFPRRRRTTNTIKSHPNNESIHMPNSSDDTLCEDTSILVYWAKPELTVIKINTDGSVTKNSAGGGGLLRDSNGDVIMAFSIPLKKCSVEQAEILALNYALKLCISLDIHKIWIEMDALSLVDAIIGSKKVTPYLSGVVRKTKNLLSSFDFSITHIYREGNYCADWLAKYGTRLDYGVDLTNQQIPKKLRSLINKDKMGLPHVRK